jgi:hypothetical protein
MNNLLILVILTGLIITNGIMQAEISGEATEYGTYFFERH